MSSRQIKCDTIDKLLEAIRGIKRQKQRPNPERIANYFKRTVGIDIPTGTVALQLEEALATGRIVKKFSRDDYTYEAVSKSSLSSLSSYSSPSVSASAPKTRRRSSSGVAVVEELAITTNVPVINDTSTIDSSWELTEDRVIAVVREMGGCRRTDLEKQLKHHWLNSCECLEDSGFSVQHSQFSRALKRAIDEALRSGRVSRDQLGRFRLEPSTEVVSTCDSESTIPAASTTTTSAVPLATPSGNRRRSAGSPDVVEKIDHQPPKKKKKMAKPIPVCSFCLGDEHLNKRSGEPEDMVACGDCGRCGHPTCLKWPLELYAKVCTLRWQCLQCKQCSFCGDSSLVDEDLLLCDGCDRGFHMHCCDPALTKPPKGKWMCNLCDPSRGRHPRSTFFNDELFSPEELADQPSHSIISAHNLLLLQRQRDSLKDGLSQYFTPSNKRNSRVSKHALSPIHDSTADHQLDLQCASPTLAYHGPPSATVVSASQPRPEEVVAAAKRLAKWRAKEEKRLVKEARFQAVEKHRHEKALLREKKRMAVAAARKRGSAGVTAARKLISKSKLKRGPKKNKDGRRSKQSEDEDSSDDESGDVPVKRKPGRPRKVVDKSGTSSLASPRASSNSPTRRKSCVGVDEDCDDLDNDDNLYKITDLDREIFQQIQKQLRTSIPPVALPEPSSRSVNPPNGLMLNGTKEDADDEEEKVKIPQQNSRPLSPLESPTAVFASSNDGARFPPKIQLGKYIIQTWYSAPYPSEYARLKILYVCEYCLKYIKSLQVYIRHMEKCSTHFPPGNEIYRHGNLSVWEVDGYTSKLYCQSLCLLAKLFLDHKTLYYDVEPFLFYVVTLCDDSSCHLIGYFSKEKHSTHKYNLSCIMVLPQYQKHGYGRFLIEFSYLLSRIEGEPGSPEKPLSELGRLSYESYWRSKLVTFVVEMLNNNNSLTSSSTAATTTSPSGESSSPTSLVIADISRKTGIDPHDVAATLQQLSTIKVNKDGKPVLAFDSTELSRLSEKYADKSPSWIQVDESCLRWCPLVPTSSSTIITPHLHSPVQPSPHTPAATNDNNNSCKTRRVSTTSSPDRRSRSGSQSEQTKRQLRGAEVTPSMSCSAERRNSEIKRQPPDSPTGGGGSASRSTPRRNSNRGGTTSSRAVNGSSRHPRGSRSTGQQRGRHRRYMEASKGRHMALLSASTPLRRAVMCARGAHSLRKRGRPRKFPIPDRILNPTPQPTIKFDDEINLNLSCLTVEIEEDEDTVAMCNDSDVEECSSLNPPPIADNSVDEGEMLPRDSSSDTDLEAPEISLATCALDETETTLAGVDEADDDAKRGTAPPPLDPPEISPSSDDEGNRAAAALEGLADIEPEEFDRTDSDSVSDIFSSSVAGVLDMAMGKEPEEGGVDAANDGGENDEIPPSKSGLLDALVQDEERVNSEDYQPIDFLDATSSEEPIPSLQDRFPTSEEEPISSLNDHFQIVEDEGMFETGEISEAGSNKSDTVLPVNSTPPPNLETSVSPGPIEQCSLLEMPDISSGKEPDEKPVKSIESPAVVPVPHSVREPTPSSLATIPAPVIFHPPPRVTSFPNTPQTPQQPSPPNPTPRALPPPKVQMAPTPPSPRQQPAATSPYRPPPQSQPSPAAPPPHQQLQSLPANPGGGYMMSMATSDVPWMTPHQQQLIKEAANPLSYTNVNSYPTKESYPVQYTNNYPTSKPPNVTVQPGSNLLTPYYPAQSTYPYKQLESYYHSQTPTTMPYIPPSMYHPQQQYSTQRTPEYPPSIQPEPQNAPYNPYNYAGHYYPASVQAAYAQRTYSTHLPATQRDLMNKPPAMVWPSNIYPMGYPHDQQFRTAPEMAQHYPPNYPYHPHPGHHNMMPH